MIEYSPAAQTDLQRILMDVYDISRDEETTRRYVRALVDKVEAKAEHPRSGIPLYWEDRFTGYYYVVYKAYLGFYYIVPGGICVERFLPAKSDYGRWLTEGPRF